MAVQVSYPGVYIDEFAPGAPIQGVGTSTAAFIGVASAGDLDTPTQITSWRAFKETFGEHPVPGFYLWYAVRGFFENGGADSLHRAGQQRHVRERRAPGPGQQQRGHSPGARPGRTEPGDLDPRSPRPIG